MRPKNQDKKPIKADKMMSFNRGYPHDMGGSQDSPFYDFSAAGSEDKVFTKDWHGRALAITIASAAYGKWNLDASRHARECLPPEDYRRFSYYDKWLSGLANLLVKHGLVEADELEQGAARKSQPPHQKAFTAESVLRMLHTGGPTSRTLLKPPAFEIGQKVRTKIPAQTAKLENGHTRLPAYAAGKTGVITKWHGAHILPDSNAHFLGESPEPLYTVCFSAPDLFAHASQNDEVCLDLWQSYLVAV